MTRQPRTPEEPTNSAGTASPSTPGKEIPAGGPQANSPDEPAVHVEVPAGWWRRAPTTDDSGRATGYTAELAIATTGRSSQIVWSTRSRKLWQLEAALGWAIPLPLQRLLIRARDRIRGPLKAGRPATSATGPVHLVDDTTITSSLYRPRRASTERIGDTQATTYAGFRPTS
ncbi:hypothetical protein [Pseudofrankia sp. BMG5.36]|uniref:hypothetical protein n=1 Tax=Pseudofrankia sp. BMG5.36 TaxID=1834512 RepID=UPI0008D9154D|nr:hypothetical protein [Pseudofrankia sp. BMG5.36]OHV58748.1 hypothetical protein BCD48_42055 [Pseudofrankia sp. BMG5.36]